jgi:MazG family protein
MAIVSETPSDGAGARFVRLLEIMRTLRAPGGCPWDREQTHASLRPFVLEETYEVLEAIEHGTPADLCEELGDFLFEAVFLAQISAEAGEFTIDDVVTGIADKLVRRHPHVFEQSSPDLTTSAQVIEAWETLKARERAAAGKVASPEPPKTALSGVPRTLPSLLRAYELSARAAAVGFDWAGPGDVVAKMQEEVAEIREVIESGGASSSSRAEEEVGDLLFAVANLARKLGVEPEAALRLANDKFTSRFTAVEHALGDRGRSLSDATLDEMESEWQRVKAREAAGDPDIDTSAMAAGRTERSGD